MSSFFDQPFNAANVDPTQGMAKHPHGKFAAYVSDTKIEPKESGNAFIVNFKTEVGEIRKFYMLDHTNPQTVEIAQKQLSALCHATGIQTVNWNDHGAALRNGRLMIEVAPQAKNPEYNEVVKVYDIHGNEPRGQGGQQSAPAQAQAQAQPQQAWGAGPAQSPAGPPQGGWAPTDLAPQQSPPAANPSPSWGAPNQGQGSAAPQQTPQGGNSGWGAPTTGQNPTPPWTR